MSPSNDAGFFHHDLPVAFFCLAVSKADRLHQLPKRCAPDGGKISDLFLTTNENLVERQVVTIFEKNESTIRRISPSVNSSSSIFGRPSVETFSRFRFPGR